MITGPYHPPARCRTLALVPNGAARYAARDAATEGGSAGMIGEGMIRITAGDLEGPRVIELMSVHVATARAETARGSAHVLDVGGLRSPDVEFWAIWDDEVLLGIGALKRLAPDHGEVKSMHTARSARRRGVGSAMLRHIVAAGRARGFARLSLETGAWDYFRSARAFYRSYGFEECAPFADHAPDPHSVFMTLDLRKP
jgi:putative acetyltransferase